MTEPAPRRNSHTLRQMLAQPFTRISTAFKHAAAFIYRLPPVAALFKWLHRQSWYLRFEAWTERQTPWQLTYKVGGVFFVTGFLFLIFFSFLVYKGAFGNLPSYAELRRIRNNQASELYSDDGVLLGKYFIENRVNASFGEISPNVINALIATEDARFFEHGGVDFRAWLRVLVKSILLSDDSSGGGSTLSQQLAKNLYPREQHLILSMVINKIKETFIARRLERIYTKEELLNLYLNTVSFSENIYGIKVAAQRFFDKSPKDLSVEEAALLVGSLKGPSIYNPVRNPEKALQRRNTVMGQMVKYGYLDQTECDSLRELPMHISYFKEGNNQGLATYFREQLRQELEVLLKDQTKPDGTPYNLYTDGLKIYSTINARMQRYAEQAVNEYMPELQRRFYDNWPKKEPWKDEKVIAWAMQNSDRYKALKEKGVSDNRIREIFNKPIRMKVFSWKGGEEERDMSPLDSIKYYLSILNTGLVAIEPETGLVRAWVGGIDHTFFKYDHVKSERHVGSTFKPIVYTQALRSGILPCEYTPNELIAYADYKNWEPRNSDGQYGGVYSLEGALSHSVNTVSVGLLMRAGLDGVRQLARDMGVTSRIPAHPSIALGTVDASLLDMVKVYGTFANLGRRPEIHYLDRVETADGKVIVAFDRPDPKSFESVISPNESLMLIKMMKSVVDSGTARRLGYEFGLYGKIAGKTGTTQNNSDGWFLGFNSRLVVGVWVGAETPLVHFRTTGAGQASITALPIWGRFMRRVYKDSRLKDWQNSYFPALPDSLIALMQCPPYLDEMPVMPEFLGSEGMENLQEFNQQVNGIDQEKLNEFIEQTPRRENETLTEYGDRIKQKAEREEVKDERREKRKAFWSKVLFGDKKDQEKKDNQ